MFQKLEYQKMDKVRKPCNFCVSKNFKQVQFNILFFTHSKKISCKLIEMHSQNYSRQLFINKTQFVYIQSSSAYLDAVASLQLFPQPPLHLHH
jgi:hypothetical protein